MIASSTYELVLKCPECVNLHREFYKDPFWDRPYSGALAREARLRSTMGKLIYPSQKIWLSRDRTSPVRPHHRETNVHSYFVASLGAQED